MANKKSFDFLKEGNDKEFDSAMKSIDSMYDNLFNGDKLDKLFENLKSDNNPITQPIDEMTKQIFNTEQQPKGPVYVKVNQPNNINDEDSDFVVGEPLYMENHNTCPPLQVNYSSSQPQAYPSHAQNNPYYASPVQGNGYFGSWQQPGNRR